MTLNNESFVNILGEEISRTTLVKIMIEYFNDLLGIDATSITDFNEGSEIRNLLESIAVDVYHLEKDNYENSRIAFIQYAYGQWLDLHGEEWECKRDLGSNSWGELEFTLPKSIGSNVRIPAGTVVVSNVHGGQYVTTVDADIIAGQTKITAPARSIVIGKKMNADKNTITIWLNGPPYNSLTVTNPERFAGGRDWETDDEYRERLLKVNRQDSFGSISYYESLGAKIEGIHDVKLVEDTSKEYTKKILINGDEKPTPEDIMLKALNVFTDQANLVTGHKFSVMKPVYVTVNLEIDVYVKSNLENNLVKSQLEYLFDGGYADYSYNGLNIGDDMSKLRIITAIEQIEGVEQVSSIMKITDDGSVNFNTLETMDDEVLKVGNVIVNQTVTGE